MTRKRVLKAYVVVFVLLLCLGGTWYGLNTPRRHYYNDAIEGRGEASPYWVVVKTQGVLLFPMGGLALLVPLIGIYESARWIASKISQHSR